MPIRYLACLCRFNTYYIIICMFSYFACAWLQQLCSVFRDLFCTWHLHTLYNILYYNQWYLITIRQTHNNTAFFGSEYVWLLYRYISYIENIILCTFNVQYSVSALTRWRWRISLFLCCRSVFRRYGNCGRSRRASKTVWNDHVETD